MNLVLQDHGYPILYTHKRNPFLSCIFRGRHKSPMVESPMSPPALESRSLPPLYLIEAATERLTIEVCP